MNFDELPSEYMFDYNSDYLRYLTIELYKAEKFVNTMRTIQYFYNLVQIVGPMDKRITIKTADDLYYRLDFCIFVAVFEAVDFERINEIDLLNNRQW